jgi:hypothetical protein
MSEEHDRVAMVSDLNAVTSEMDAALKRLETRITEEGKTTRRHVDVMVEKVNDSVRLVAEVTAHHSTVLDDHEARLQTIEKR